MSKALPFIVFAAALCCPWLPAQDSVAIKAGKVITVTGPVLENAVILVENGRIAKVGGAADIEVPWDAKVIDASDKVVMPTYVIAHTSDGMRGSNENLVNVPYLTVADAIDPSDSFYEECLRNGVGTIHVIPGNATLIGGRGMVLRPYGRTVEDMAVAADSGLKLSLQPAGSRGGATVRMGRSGPTVVRSGSSGGSLVAQIRKLRRALDDVRDYVADYERQKKEFEAEKKAGAIPADKEWEQEYDKTKKPVIELLSRKLRGFLYVPSAAAVTEALRLAGEFDAVMILGKDCYKAAVKLAKLDAPVILDDEIEFWEKNEETDEDKKICTARAMADAGIPFAMSIGGSGARRYPWWQMATAIRDGVDRKLALEAFTTVPARILGLEDQLGSIAEGKVANLQILTGEPLLATTWVDMVLLEGELVYERSKDERLKYLFGQRDEGETGEVK